MDADWVPIWFQKLKHFGMRNRIFKELQVLKGKHQPMIWFSKDDPVFWIMKPSPRRPGATILVSVELGDYYPYREPKVTSAPKYDIFYLLDWDSKPYFIVEYISTLLEALRIAESSPKFFSGHRGYRGSAWAIWRGHVPQQKKNTVG